MICTFLARKLKILGEGGATCSLSLGNIVNVVKGETSKSDQTKQKVMINNAVDANYGKISLS